MFDKFLDSQRNANTRAVYARGLAYFAAWATKDVSQLKVRDIKAYRSHLEVSLAATSVNAYLSALRAALKWAASEELIDPSVYQASTVVSSLKTPETLPAVLDDQQTEDLLNAPGTTTADGRRDLAIIALLVSSGLRVGELASLDIEHLNWERREMRVIGKGSKERAAFFNRRAAEALVAYLKGREVGPLFINRSGERLSVRYLQQSLAAYDGLRPHTLRHTFATRYLDETGDLDATRRLLGHSSATTTQLYTRMANKRLRAQYAEAMDPAEIIEFPGRKPLELVRTTNAGAEARYKKVP